MSVRSILEIRVREKMTDIAESQRTDQRIDQRMDGNIRVTVPEESPFIRNFHPAENQRTPFRKAVHVATLTDPDI